MRTKHIIHVNSPHWDTNQQVERIDDLTRTVQNIFAIAETNGLQTIALPSISSGGFVFSPYFSLSLSTTVIFELPISSLNKYLTT